MLEKIKSIKARYDEINLELQNVGNNYQRAAELSKEKSDLDPVISKGKEYQDILNQISESKELLESEKDPEIRELASMDLEDLTPKSEKIEQELISLMIPKDKRDSRNVIFEIRAGTGGNEAGLFAADLFRMYTRFAERKRWKVEVLSQNETGIGGFKEIIFMVKGKGAFSKLKFESGVHRVQRIPVTESSGRIHTSTITVAVLAEVEDVDIEIPTSDIKMDVYKSAGAGGQSVQKNSTAVRLTHIPTGIVVACQDERSQLQNRQRAMGILRARLYEQAELKRQQEEESTRRSMVGTGERSEKIRTYNYPQSRVTDHRVNVSSFNLPSVLDGEIDQFIEELALQEETERLSMMGLED
ncbi:MAG: peptide chain release factor 1 [Anaerolineaceae bacterium]|nr:peptide chain release factor 1 [Anaerolineaceae bacterium]